MLTPARRRGVELLDDPSIDSGVRARSMLDVTRSNRWLGGMRAALIEARAALTGVGSNATLLDVGSGLADIPVRIAREAQRMGKSVETIAVDEATSILRASKLKVSHVVCADARDLPFADHSIDIVICSQILHHFEQTDAERFLKELDRIARSAVIVADLRRSWIAAVGFWFVSFPLRFHRVTRHDGVVSVLRGFTPRELQSMIRAATGLAPHVHRRLGFRLTARWTPSSSTKRLE